MDAVLLNMCTGTSRCTSSHSCAVFLVSQLSQHCRSSSRTSNKQRTQRCLQQN